ncbi:MAG: ACT domain-containing protein [Gammaproteobacteria bacterium]
MNHTLNLTIEKVEGAIIRTLGLIERRGFSVTSIDARANEGDQEMELVIQFTGTGRPAEVLARQIDKLFDVKSVHLVPTKAPAVAPAESMAC